MTVLISVISFMLDGVLSKYLYSTLLVPFLTIVSLVMIYPYFKNNNYRYLKYIAILGLLYDIVYMNTIFYNFFVYILIGFIIIFIDYLLSNNLYVNLLTTVVCIIFYIFINQLFMALFQNDIFSFNYLFKSIYSSLILNILYCILLYSITYLYNKKHKVLRGK